MNIAKYFKFCVLYKPLQVSQSELRSTPLLTLLFALLLTASSCSSVQQEKIVYQNPNIPEHLFKNGDIVFRRGRSFSSEMVLMCEENQHYSHVGILIKRNDSCFVVHASPDEKDEQGKYDKVMCEPLSDFWQAKRAKEGGVYRIFIGSDTLEYISKTALELAKEGRPFDHSFSLNDTNKIYCSELIHILFMKYGIDLSQGKRVSANYIPFGEDIILPEHLLSFPKKEYVFYYPKKH